MVVQLRWNELGVQKERMSLIKDVNPNDTENIKIALNDGWVITFHKELQNLLSLFVKDSI
jgi:hypothetical protein